VKPGVAITLNASHLWLHRSSQPLFCAQRCDRGAIDYLDPNFSLINAP
jgi:hypothetical protein